MDKLEFLKKVALFETDFYSAPSLMGEYEDFYFCGEEFTLNFDPGLYDDPVEACLMFFGALLDVYNANGWVFSLKAGYDDAQNTAYIENPQASDTNWVMDLSVLSGFSWSISGNINAPSKAYFEPDDIALKSFLPD